MPPLPHDDYTDPLEMADHEETHLEDEDAIGEDEIVPEEPARTPVDLPPEIEEEIEKVMVVEEPESVAAKPKSHMIPAHLINEPLKPEDLWDENDGTI